MQPFKFPVQQKKNFEKILKTAPVRQLFVKGCQSHNNQIWLEPIQAERMTKAFPPLQHFSSPAFPSPRTPQSSLTCHKTYTFTPLMIMGQLRVNTGPFLAFNRKNPQTKLCHYTNLTAFYKKLSHGHSFQYFFKISLFLNWKFERLRVLNKNLKIKS